MNLILIFNLNDIILYFFFLKNESFFFPLRKIEFFFDNQNFNLINKFIDFLYHVQQYGNCHNSKNY